MPGIRAILVWLAFLLAWPFSVTAETTADAPAFDPIKLKPIDGLTFTELLQFESSLQLISDESEAPVTRIVLRQLGRSDMSLEDNLVHERLEIEQSVLASDVPEYNVEWTYGYTEEWMRMANGRIRLFHSTLRTNDRGKNRNALTEPDETLQIMSEMLRGMDLLLPMLVTPMIGNGLAESGRPFPSNSREAQSRIENWISPAASYGTKLYGDNAIMHEFGLRSLMFGLWLQWRSDLAYQGTVTRDGVSYLRFGGNFTGTFALPDTDMLLAVSSLEPMELLIDPETGHETYLMLDYGIAIYIEDYLIHARYGRQRDWKFPERE